MNNFFSAEKQPVLLLRTLFATIGMSIVLVINMISYTVEMRGQLLFTMSILSMIIILYGIYQVFTQTPIGDGHPQKTTVITLYPTLK